MTRVLIASRAANTLGSSSTSGHSPQTRPPRAARPGLTRRVLAALTARRRGRTIETPATGRRARELAVSARAQR
jgi:hypothetical protein